MCRVVWDFFAEFFLGEWFWLIGFCCCCFIFFFNLCLSLSLEIQKILPVPSRFFFLVVKEFQVWYKKSLKHCLTLITHRNNNEDLKCNGRNNEIILAEVQITQDSFVLHLEGLQPL